jgi:hypothetical protein
LSRLDNDSPGTKLGQKATQRAYACAIAKLNDGEWAKEGR